MFSENYVQIHITLEAGKNQCLSSENRPRFLDKHDLAQDIQICLVLNRNSGIRLFSLLGIAGIGLLCIRVKHLVDLLEQCFLKRPEKVKN